MTAISGISKAIRFLQDGIRHNETAPRLEWYLGWIISYKLGRADEHLQFRRLFREDSDFNGKRKIEDRDNWLVGREFHLEAEDDGGPQRRARRRQSADVLLPRADVPD